MPRKPSKQRQCPTQANQQASGEASHAQAGAVVKESLTTRPAESPTTLTTTHCGKCQSDQRTPYTMIRSREVNGMHITWNRTRCTQCSQTRVDVVRTPAA